MIYFLDADFLIRAKNEHFQIDRVPEFWDWLVQNGRAGKIKIPLPIYEEIVRREDPLKDWLSSNKEILRIEDPDALERLLRVKRLDRPAAEPTGAFQMYAERPE